MIFNKVSDFYKSNKYAIWWTIGYVFVTWAIMKYMFNFDIFSSLRWHQLMHAHLHGFAGMVFGVLILAAIPMYIATTIVVARTKSPLFSIKIPNFIKTFLKNAFTQTPMDESTPETVKESVSEKPTENATQPESIPTTTDQDPEPKPIPDTVPSEMRVAYARAREHISNTPTSVFNLSNTTKSTTHKNQTSAPDETIEPEIPIPTDFDIDDVDDMIDSVPKFTDITFDDDEDDETPIDITSVETVSDTTTPITEFLKSQSVPYDVTGEVVTTDKFAIVAHNDPDFWVADSEMWFAAGKTRKSPISTVKNIADAQGKQAVLYLGTNNIMDIDTLRKTWESDGIRIVTDLKDLI